MSWLALLLIGLGLADLLHSVRDVRRWPESIAGALVVVLWVLADLTSPADLAALVGVVVAVLAWGWTVRDGFGRDRAWLPLTVLGVAVGAALVLSVYAGEAGGAVQRWLDETPIPVLSGLTADRALLVAGVLLVQMSTGNVVVRLVLRATGTVDPARGAAHDATRTLKGGRLLGPMERLFIVGLALAGHVTAASIVIAAKGLLRFPELQASREGGGPNIDEVTEYFLVGSFVSWTVALLSLVLLAQ
ncbi:hypothetical protein [Marmoricola sp. RAF53]|uniref:hypothetical protein n=1 Tax=Marmoricola sp. RAF53 TaxID=3233059 RepID=UPI003F962E29